jgi:putative copper resistance protein D
VRGGRIAGVWERKRRLWLGGLTGIVLACVVALWVLLIPAYPTSYAVSPAPYDVSAIAAGSVLYAQHCSGCHGRYGQGDGSAAASLPKKLPKLDEHGPDHRPGDLFWLIAHGRPQTAMRAFSPAMSDAEIWKLIQFLRAQADAEEARSMTDDVHQWRPVEVVAPDFTFEFPGRGQESLKEQRNRSNTLIVFYTLPQSLSRIRALAAAQPALAATGLRILALPTNLSKPVESESASDGESIFPRASPDVFVAYSMFTRAADKDDGFPAHVEFLIDRQGYLRALVRCRMTGRPDG